MLEKKAPSSDAVIFEKKKRGMEPLVLMLSLTGHLIRSTAVAKDTAGQPLLETLMGSTKLLSALHLGCSEAHGPAMRHFYLVMSYSVAIVTTM